MPTIRCKLVTIITEAVLESELPEVLDTLGASGYTVTNARGKGSRGIRDAGWTSSSNIRVEVICSRELCLLYTSPSPRDIPLSRMPSSA